MTSAKLSVIVTTQRKYIPLLAMLQSLRFQGEISLDVHLGVQGDEDEKLFRNANMPFALNVIDIPPSSLSKARNFLLPHATGELVTFADDDCVYPQDLFPLVAKFMHETPACGAAVCDWGDAIKASGPRKQGREQLFSRANSIRLFFRREALRLVGDFDETMGIGSPTPWQSGEETDILLRMLDAGYEVWRIPSPPILHPDPMVFTPVAPEKNMGYARGRLHVLGKHQFPLWFCVLNVLFPLFAICSDIGKAVKYIFPYRWHMFKGRVQGLFSLLGKK